MLEVAIVEAIRQPHGAHHWRCQIYISRRPAYESDSYVNTANQTSDFPSINDIKYLSCTYLSMCNEHANEEERQNGRAESSVWNLDAKMAS